MKASIDHAIEHFVGDHFTADCQVVRVRREWRSLSVLVILLNLILVELPELLHELVVAVLTCLSYLSLDGLVVGADALKADLSRMLDFALVFHFEHFFEELARLLLLLPQNVLLILNYLFAEQVWA